MSQVMLHVSPTEFFREQLQIVTSKLNFVMPDDIEYYVVNLLCEFIGQTKLKISEEEIDLFNTPIALMVKKALESKPEDQVKMFKAVGDTSLYISGYFQDYFNDKIFNLDYFIGLGSNAYNNVSNLTRELYKDRNCAKTYGSLSENFKQIVELVAEISDNLGTAKSQNVLAIYDRWIRNQSSDRLRKKLELNGIIPQVVNIKIPQ